MQRFPSAAQIEPARIERDPIAEWLLDCALGSVATPEMVAGLSERLIEEGFDLARVHLSHTTLHPLLEGLGATWTSTDGLEELDYAHKSDDPPGDGAFGANDVDDDDGWLLSPIRHAIVTNQPVMRRRLTGGDATLDFPILEMLATEGLTDYTLLLCGYDGFMSTANESDPAAATAGMACSFATARPDGFTEAEIARLARLRKPIGAVVKMADQRAAAHNLAVCYIGREAGPRVLGGAIRRGDFASTEAVVWLSDLRASTEMSHTLSRRAFLTTLNDFFDRTAGAVEREGGEVLTFIGDSALAIFPIEELGADGARRAAIEAARRAGASLEELNAARGAAGEPCLRWGVALHAGVLEYGNIGSLGRHSWTVIGPVVNETARLESLTKTTGEPVVASRAFAAPLGDWRPLGAFDMAGVAPGFEAFAPPLPAGRADQAPNDKTAHEKETPA